MDSVKPKSKEDTDRSHRLFTRATELMPGGVNSPVRALIVASAERRGLSRAL